MDRLGMEVQGTVEAGTKAEAADRLRAQGYFTTSLMPANSDPNRSWPCPRCGFVLVGPVERCDQCGAWVSQPDVSVAPVAIPSGPAQPAGQDTELNERLLALLRQGKKIPAIKLHREVTGVGLKESKDFVESLARTNGLPTGGVGCTVTTLLIVIVVIFARMA